MVNAVEPGVVEPVIDSAPPSPIHSSTWLVAVVYVLAVAFN